MDCRNRFESRGTMLIIRLEYLIALGICLVLAVMHVENIRWIPFILLFAYIDLIGYLPGAVVHRRRGGQVPRAFYILYNTMHNFVFNGAVIGIWCLLIGPEWALLAIPIHLFGDRSLFGNFLKTWGVSFEPEVHPAFARFEREFGNWQT